MKGLNFKILIGTENTISHKILILKSPLIYEFNSCQSQKNSIDSNILMIHIKMILSKSALPLDIVLYPNYAGNLDLAA